MVLNDAMRLISGTLKPTPKEMLPVVSGIPPASIQRDYQVLKLAEKAVKEDTLVPHVQDDTIPQRIPRQHFATKAAALRRQGPLSTSWVEQKWQGEWRSSHTTLHTFIESPSTEPRGHVMRRCDTQK